MQTLRQETSAVNGTGLSLETDLYRYRVALERCPEDGGLVVRLTDQWGETTTAGQDGTGEHWCECGWCDGYIGCPHSQILEETGIFTEDPRARQWRERMKRFRRGPAAPALTPATLLADDGVEF